MARRLVIGIGYLFVGIVVLSLVAAVSAYALSERRLTKEHQITPRPLVVRHDSTSLARGEHIAQAIGMCVECHGEQLQGKVLIDNGAMGVVVAPNLTRGTGGVGKQRTETDLVRAIRHGVGPGGRALMIMPSEDYIHLSDDDLAAVIAYVKSVPAVDNVLPASGLGPVARALVAAGKMPLFHAERIDHSRVSPPTPPEGATPEYGRYLAQVACMGCHGPALAGGPIPAGDPNWPPAANLTPDGSTKSWTEADFFRLMRTGRRPDGAPVNSAMPWKVAGRMTDDELRAIWLYLRSVPGQPTPGTSQTASN